VYVLIWRGLGIGYILIVHIQLLTELNTSFCVKKYMPCYLLWHIITGTSYTWP